jgi:hypothetical protein
MSDYSGLPDERAGRSRLERLGCGLGCIGFVIGAAGAIAIAVALLWLLSSGD